MALCVGAAHLSPWWSVGLSRRIDAMGQDGLDDELRAVTLAHVQQLRLRFNGRIPREEIGRGVMLRGKRVPIWNYQKGIFKPALLGRDGAALSVQTSAESPYTDAHDAISGHFVYKYRGADPAHLDNVALRRAMVERKPLAYFVAIDPGVYDAVAPVYVTGDQPDRLEFRLLADQGLAVDAMGEDLATTVRREYVTRAVLQRLHQQQFRRVVLAAYRERCAVCRLRHSSCLTRRTSFPIRTRAVSLSSRTG